MTTSPRLAAIVVHFGDPAPTLRCLDSLDGIDEVILIDQPPTLVGDHPRVTTRIEPGVNLGFAAACNRGVAATEAAFVLLLNNDAVLERDASRAVSLALPFLPPELGGVCLKLLDMDGVTLQSAGGLWFTRDGIGFPRGFGERDRGQYDGAPDDVVGVPSGAAALYRREAWIDAGGMDEDFFCYCEDGDLGLRMVALGYRFSWLPQVRVRHELSGASGAHSLFKAFHVERNHFATMLHTAPGPVIAALPLVTLVRIAQVAMDAMRGRAAGRQLVRTSSPVALAVTLAAAWVGALRMLPRALAKRRALLRREPDAIARVGRFLTTRQASLSQFRQSRDRKAPRS
ncbi:MAG: hypothetical protein ABR587_09775 [Candidatus Binatia bacterium]